MKVELLHITVDAELHIERCGRTCYKSFDKITEGSAERFIKMLIKNNHLSVIEHASATFRISGVSRALTHQLVRHRLLSISQQSQRYVKEDQFEYILPSSVIANQFGAEYTNLMESIQSLYTKMVASGVKAEDARMVLPQSCTTEIVITGNFRELRHVIEERISPAAQWEIRELATEMLSILKEKAPSCFGDLG